MSRQVFVRWQVTDGEPYAVESVSSDKQPAALEAWARRRKTANALAMRYGKGPPPSPRLCQASASSHANRVSYTDPEPRPKRAPSALGLVPRARAPEAHPSDRPRRRQLQCSARAISPSTTEESATTAFYLWPGTLLASDERASTEASTR
jgi:hypothetical protein